MKKYAHVTISIIMILIIMTLVGCSDTRPVETNKTEVLKAIKEIEKALSEDDLSLWSSNITSTSLNKYFKVLTFYTCILGKYNEGKELISLTPVSMRESDGVVEVDMSIDYNGTINFLYFDILRGVIRKSVQLGMPTEVTCKFKYVDNKYKLSDMSFSLLYDSLFYTQGML